MRTEVTHVGIPRPPGNSPARHSDYSLSAGEAVRYEERIAVPASTALIEGSISVEVQAGSDELSDSEVQSLKDRGGGAAAGDLPVLELLTDEGKGLGFGGASPVARRRPSPPPESPDSDQKENKSRTRTLSLKIARFAVSTDASSVRDLDLPQDTAF